jgi:hypothetical protein
MTELAQQEEQTIVLARKHPDPGTMHTVEMGLSDATLPVAYNDSAKELMQQVAVRELAMVLTGRMRQNASNDRTIKEFVRAKRKVIVTSTLCHSGDPSGKQKHTTGLLLCRSVMLAGEFSV